MISSRRFSRALADVGPAAQRAERNRSAVMRSSALSLLIACIGLGNTTPLRPARADDWPQWRGPNRDGEWRDRGIIDSIPPAGLPVRWRARVLNGWSGPAVASGRVYVTDHNYKSDPEVERVLCFSETTGQLLWLFEYPCPYGDMEYGNGPRATPTVHDKMVYTLGTKGHLVCLNAESGELVWKKDLAQDLNAQ